MNSKLLIVFIVLCLPYCVSGQNVTSSFVCLDGERSCSNNGHCNFNNTACLCDDSHATFDDDNASLCQDESKCCYKRKKQMTIFLMHFFLGVTGAGYFMLGQIQYGLASIAMLTGGFCSVCFFACCLAQCTKTKSPTNKISDLEQGAKQKSYECFDEECPVFSMKCVYYLMLVAFVGLWITGLVVIGNCSMLDGDSVKMECNM